MTLLKQKKVELQEKMQYFECTNEINKFQCKNLGSTLQEEKYIGMTSTSLQGELTNIFRVKNKKIWLYLNRMRLNYKNKTVC